MDNEFGKLRKKAFGGFNRKDVVNVIEKSRNELYEYKTEAQKNIEELKEKLQKAESERDALLRENADLVKVNCELQESNKEVEALKEAYESLKAESEEKENALSPDSLTALQINAATDELKRVADDLCNSLRDFMDKIAESSVSVTLQSKEEEPFDAEKFMAELEAEIYAKLGVDDNACESIDEEYTLSEEEEFSPGELEKEDKASEILSKLSFFSEKVENPKEEKSVLDILKGASFLG